MTEKPTADVRILNKNGKKLCAIHCPQGWTNYIPVWLPPFIFFWRKKWADPQVIIRWAWHQAFESNTYSMEHNTAALDLDAPPTPCVACGKLSIKPIKVTGLLRSVITGVQCENNQCTMYHVTVPWQMFQHIKEVPTEYIP